MSAEIISTGNELLMGLIENSNAKWLARKLTELGFEVKRITVVSDKKRDISQAFKEAIERETNVVISTGGLGPTLDDKTLEALAETLNLKIATNKEALEMIKLKCKVHGLELNQARLKMALLPVNAEPIENPSGLAPAVKIKTGKTIIYCLPGVPVEMKKIFRKKILPELTQKNKQLLFKERKAKLEGVFESELVPVLKKVREEFPDVYVKTRVVPTKGIILYCSTKGLKKEAQEKLNKVIKIVDSYVNWLSKERGRR